MVIWTIFRINLFLRVIFGHDPLGGDENNRKLSDFYDEGEIKPFFSDF